MSVSQKLATRIFQYRNLEKRAIESGDTELWNQILAFSDIWEFRHDVENGYSVDMMTVEELKQTLVADVLMSSVLRNKGAHGIYPTKQMFRHMPEHMMRTKIVIFHDCLTAVRTLPYIHEDSFGLYILPEDFLTASDYCGVYHDITDGDDAVEALLDVGGPALLEEELNDLFEKCMDVH
mgnify:CR=1 FL=1